MHPRQRVTRGGAVRDLRSFDRNPVESRDEPRGLAVEKTPQRAAAIGLGGGRLNARARQMRHQVEIERQVFRRQPLVQRQYETPIVGGQKIVCVLDAGNDGFEFMHRAKRVTGEPYGKIISGDSGVDSHRRTRQAAAESPALNAEGYGCDQKENSSHIGILRPVSRLSRRTHVPSEPSATR